MPTYTYKCKQCDHQGDYWLSMRAAKGEILCDKCENGIMSKQIHIVTAIHNANTGARKGT